MLLLIPFLNFDLFTSLLHEFSASYAFFYDRYVAINAIHSHYVLLDPYFEKEFLFHAARVLRKFVYCHF